VHDQISNPTWARVLGVTTTLLIARGGDHFLHWPVERKGLYLLSGDGFASCYAWAKEILKLDTSAHEHTVNELIHAATVIFPSPAYIQKTPFWIAKN
jgi:dTDP-4-dehydrorhamnose reductase